jgi:sn-glycerol 3-phosphate transport system permease protein
MTGTRKIFVGFTNFIRLFKNPDYLNSLLLSLMFAVFVVFIGLLISIYIARIATNILDFFGFHFEYISNGIHAMVFIIITAIWKMLGYNIIFTLAGLQSVPNEIIEAAIIDGAKKGQVFWKIMFPFISPTVFFLFIMNTLYAFFQQFGLLHMITEGGPGRATDLLVYKLYRDGFIAMDTGGASAQSIILLVFVSVIMAIQFRITQKSVFYGA